MPIFSKELNLISYLIMLFSFIVGCSQNNTSVIQDNETSSMELRFKQKQVSTFKTKGIQNNISMLKLALNIASTDGLIKKESGAIDLSDGENKITNIKYLPIGKYIIDANLLYKDGNIEKNSKVKSKEILIEKDKVTGVNLVFDVEKSKLNVEETGSIDINANISIKDVVQNAEKKEITFETQTKSAQTSNTTTQAPATSSNTTQTNTSAQPNIDVNGLLNQIKVPASTTNTTPTAPQAPAASSNSTQTNTSAQPNIDVNGLLNQIKVPASTTNTTPTAPQAPAASSNSTQTNTSAQQVVVNNTVNSAVITAPQVQIITSESNFINTAYNNTKFISKILYNQGKKGITFTILKDGGGAIGYNGRLVLDINGENRQIEYLAGSNIEFTVPLSSLLKTNYSCNINLFPSNLNGGFMRATGTPNLSFRVF